MVLPVPPLDFADDVLREVGRVAVWGSRVEFLAAALHLNATHDADPVTDERVAQAIGKSGQREQHLAVVAEMGWPGARDWAAEAREALQVRNWIVHAVWTTELSADGTAMDVVNFVHAGSGRQPENRSLLLDTLRQSADNLHRLAAYGALFADHGRALHPDLG